MWYSHHGCKLHSTAWFYSVVNICVHLWQATSVSHSGTWSTCCHWKVWRVFWCCYIPIKLPGTAVQLWYTGQGLLACPLARVGSCSGKWAHAHSPRPRSPFQWGMKTRPKGATEIEPCPFCGEGFDFIPFSLLQVAASASRTWNDQDSRQLEQSCLSTLDKLFPKGLTILVSHFRQILVFQTDLSSSSQADCVGVVTEHCCGCELTTVSLLKGDQWLVSHWSWLLVDSWRTLNQLLQYNKFLCYYTENSICMQNHGTNACSVYTKAGHVYIPRPLPGVKFAFSHPFKTDAPEHNWIQYVM